MVVAIVVVAVSCVVVATVIVAALCALVVAIVVAVVACAAVVAIVVAVVPCAAVVAIVVAVVPCATVVDAEDGKGKGSGAVEFAFSAASPWAFRFGAILGQAFGCCWQQQIFFDRVHW